MKVPPRALRVATAAALLALMVWSVWQRWDVLAASPFPFGVDGYFYSIQVRSLIEHGTLVYPASPLAFWFIAPFAAVTDPIVGVKLGAAVGGALIAIPAYLVGARLGKGRGPGLFAAMIATTSAGSSYLSIEFIKQGIGITVAMCALWFVLRAIEGRTLSRWGQACPWIVAAFLTHKVAAALVVLVGAPAAFAELRATGALRGRRLLYVIAGAIGIAIVVVSIGALFPQRFISGADLALVRHAFTSHARWDAPALAAPGLNLTLGYEPLLAAGGAIVAGALLIVQRLGGALPKPSENAASQSLEASKSLPVTRAQSVGARSSWVAFAQRIGSALPKYSPGDRVALWVVIALGVAIGIPWLAVSDPQGLGFRLRVAAFVPAALCAAIVARAALGKLDELLRDGACVVFALVFACYAAGIDRTEGQVLAHPALVAGAMALEDQIPANATVIVPERHVAFMIAWYTRAPVSLRPDSIAPAHRVRVLLPLSSMNYNWPLEPALDAARRDGLIAPPIGVHPRHRNGLVLVTEATWQWMLAQMPAREQRHFAAWPTI